MTRPQPAAPPVPAPTHPVDVFVVLFNGDKVLLGLREGTGYRDGWWNVPSGKLEYHEDALTGVRWEALEEIGVRFTGDEPHFAGVVHHRNPEGQGCIALVFAAEYDVRRHGEPVNREPHKCADIRWADPAQPPATAITYTVAALDQIRSGRPFSLDGWQEHAPPAGLV